MCVENGTISILSVNGVGDSYHAKCGHAYPKDPDIHNGTWEVYFPEQPLSEYLVLYNGTDYDYYSAVYSCKESDIGTIFEEGLILTR